MNKSSKMQLYMYILSWLFISISIISFLEQCHGTENHKDTEQWYSILGSPRALWAISISITTLWMGATGEFMGVGGQEQVSAWGFLYSQKGLLNHYIIVAHFSTLLMLVKSLVGGSRTMSWCSLSLIKLFISPLLECSYFCQSKKEEVKAEY